MHGVLQLEGPRDQVESRLVLMYAVLGERTDALVATRTVHRVDGPQLTAQ
jgi:hypothetical protein